MPFNYFVGDALTRTGLVGAQWTGTQWYDYGSGWYYLDAPPNTWVKVDAGGHIPATFNTDTNDPNNSGAVYLARQGGGGGGGGKKKRGSPADVQDLIQRLSADHGVRRRASEDPLVVAAADCGYHTCEAEIRALLRLPASERDLIAAVELHLNKFGGGKWYEFDQATGYGS